MSKKGGDFDSLSSRKNPNINKGMRGVKK